MALEVLPEERRAAEREGDAVMVSKSRSQRIMGWLLIGTILLFTLFPLYWMLRTAFSNNRAMFSDPTSLLPVDFTFGPIKRVFGLATPEEALAEGGSGASISFGRYLLNSAIVCTAITLGQITFSCMAAYAFARLRWPGREVVFWIFLVSMMIPGIFVILPNFLLIKQLNMLNTYWGIILPSLLVSPFCVFYLRQFFLGVNWSITEAATIDGAGHFRIFSRIMLPIAMPQIIVLGLLQFIFYWNDYLWPLLVAQDDSMRTLTVGLGVFKSQTPQGSPDWAGLMAGALIAAIPIFILFVVFGRRIIGSIQMSAVK